MPRPMTDADRSERAELLADEGLRYIDTHRPMPAPSIPRPGAVRRIPTRPGLLGRLLRLINWSKL